MTRLSRSIGNAAAVIVARVTGPNGPWLWNIDMPKIDYPRASLLQDALAAGRLPFWDDRLGLGFPLYAEGQIGPFYPPNWLIFQLDPLDSVRRCDADAPQTPLSSGMRTQAGRPWNGPTSRSPDASSSR